MGARVSPARRRPSSSPRRSRLLEAASLICAATVVAAGQQCEDPDAFRGPSTDEMQQRFERATQHRAAPGRVFRGTSSPVSFLFRGLLAAAEVKALLKVLRDGWSRQEARSPYTATVTLDKHPTLNASEAVQGLNRKLSLLADYPESHVEEGYFSVYNAGHQLDALHIDNHHALFEPRRAVSFVIYLRGEQTGLVGGRTVFPLAEIDDQLPAVGADGGSTRPLAEMVAAADAQLNLTYHEHGSLQEGRICSEDTGGVCMEAFRRARVLCESDSAPEAVAVRARAGDAVMFYQWNRHGTPSVRAFHASCGVDDKEKIVLAKFIRGGPKPYYDEAAFAAALRQERQRSS